MIVLLLSRDQLLLRLCNCISGQESTVLYKWGSMILVDMVATTPYVYELTDSSQNITRPAY